MVKRMKTIAVHQGYEFQRVAEESRHGSGENVNDASDKRSDLPELTNTVVILQCRRN